MLFICVWISGSIFSMSLSYSWHGVINGITSCFPMLSLFDIPTRILELNWLKFTKPLPEGSKYSIKGLISFSCRIFNSFNLEIISFYETYPFNLLKKLIKINLFTIFIAVKFFKNIISLLSSTKNLVFELI